MGKKILQIMMLISIFSTADLALAGESPDSQLYFRGSLQVFDIKNNEIYLTCRQLFTPEYVDQICNEESKWKLVDSSWSHTSRSLVIVLEKRAEKGSVDYALFSLIELDELNGVSVWTYEGRNPYPWYSWSASWAKSGRKAIVHIDSAWTFYLSGNPQSGFDGLYNKIKSVRKNSVFGGEDVGFNWRWNKAEQMEFCFKGVNGKMLSGLYDETSGNIKTVLKSGGGDWCWQ